MASGQCTNHVVTKTCTGVTMLLELDIDETARSSLRPKARQLCPIADRFCVASAADGLAVVRGDLLRQHHTLHYLATNSHTR
jgi:hypothetical protein